MRVEQAKRAIEEARDQGFVLKAIRLEEMPRRWFWPWERKVYRLTIWHPAIGFDLEVDSWGAWSWAKRKAILPPWQEPTPKPRGGPEGRVVREMWVGRLLAPVPEGQA